MIHTHRLDQERHAAFLAEQRKDPLTRKPFRVGDEIVVCAECGSAFSIDSWNHLGGDGHHSGTVRDLGQRPSRILLRSRRLFRQRPPPTPPPDSTPLPPSPPTSNTSAFPVIAVIFVVLVAGALIIAVLTTTQSTPSTTTYPTDTSPTIPETSTSSGRTISATNATPPSGAIRVWRIISTAHSNVNDAWTQPGPFPDARVHFGNVLFPGPDIRWHGTISTTDEKICLGIDDLTAPAENGDPLRGNAYSDVTVGYVIGLENGVFDDHTMTKTVLIYQTRDGDRPPNHLERCESAHLINTPASAPQLAGTWEGTFTFNNQPTTFTMQLTQDNNHLTGTSNDHDSYARTATIDGYITNDGYVTLIKRYQNSITQTYLIGTSYTARITDAGKLTGGWSSGLLTGTWTATNGAVQAATLPSNTSEAAPPQSETNAPTPIASNPPSASTVTVDATQPTDTITPLPLSEPDARRVQTATIAPLPKTDTSMAKTPALQSPKKWRRDHQ